MLALYQYIVACVYFYFIEADEPNANSFVRIGEVIFWPVVVPLYMGVLWYKNRAG